MHLVRGSELQGPVPRIHNTVLAGALAEPSRSALHGTGVWEGLSSSLGQGRQANSFDVFISCFHYFIMFMEVYGETKIIHREIKVRFCTIYAHPSVSKDVRQATMACMAQEGTSKMVSSSTTAWRSQLSSDEVSLVDL